MILRAGDQTVSMMIPKGLVSSGIGGTLHFQTFPNTPRLTFENNTFNPKEATVYRLRLWVFCLKFTQYFFIKHIPILAELAIEIRVHSFSILLNNHVI